MTLRLGWILLSIALGLAFVPGCQVFSYRAYNPEPPSAVPAKIETTTPKEWPPSPSPSNPKLEAKKNLEPPLVVPTPVEENRVSQKPLVLKPQPIIQSTSLQSTDATPPALAKGRQPIVDALQCMLDDRHQEALQHLQVYDQDTQEFYLRILPTIAIFAKKSWDQISPAEINILDDQLRNLLNSLRSRAELSIDKMCYCEWIKNYGIYKPCGENHTFLAAVPGRPGDLVQMYVELRNFASEPREGSFETRLSSSVELRDAKGNLRRTISFDDNKQPLKSLTRLHDYYNNYSFYVPNELEPGVYQLTVQVIDETIPEARRVARKSLEFRVGASSSQR